MDERPDPCIDHPSTTPLPADRAFVLQLRSLTDAGADPFVGRIEHIASGAAARFASAGGLIEFVKRVLGAAQRISTEEEK